MHCYTKSRRPCKFPIIIIIIFFGENIVIVNNYYYNLCLLKASEVDIEMLTHHAHQVHTILYKYIHNIDI